MDWLRRLTEYARRLNVLNEHHWSYRPVAARRATLVAKVIGIVIGAILTPVVAISTFTAMTLPAVMLSAVAGWIFAPLLALAGGLHFTSKHPVLAFLGVTETHLFDRFTLLLFEVGGYFEVDSKNGGQRRGTAGALSGLHRFMGHMLLLAVFKLFYLSVLGALIGARVGLAGSLVVAPALGIGLGALTGYLVSKLIARALFWGSGVFVVARRRWRGATVFTH